MKQWKPNQAYLKKKIINASIVWTYNDDVNEC